jgi:hypothetical protein
MLKPQMLYIYQFFQGRLPIDNKAIDDALEVGLTKCLLQLQKTNPSLLLTTSELRKVERDARYVPAVAMALSSILTKSVTKPDPTVLDRIMNWETATGAAGPGILNSAVKMSDNSSQHSLSSNQNQQAADRNIKAFNTQNVVILGRLIEDRLRFVITQEETVRDKSKRKQITKRLDPKETERENVMSCSSPSGDYDDVPSIEGPHVDWDLLQQHYETNNKTSKRSNKTAILLGNAACVEKIGDSESQRDFEDWL